MLPNWLRTPAVAMTTVTQCVGCNISIAVRVDSPGDSGAVTQLTQVDASSIGEAVAEAAQAASQVVNERNRNFLVPCVPKDEKAADESCARLFLSSVGRLVYRRPIEPERLDQFRRFAQVALWIEHRSDRHQKSCFVSFQSGLDVDPVNPQVNDLTIP